MASKKESFKFHKGVLKDAKLFADPYIYNVDMGALNPISEKVYDKAVKCSTQIGAELTRVSNRRPPTLGIFDTNTNPEHQQCIAERRAAAKEKETQGTLPGFYPDMKNFKL